MSSDLIINQPILKVVLAFYRTEEAAKYLEATKLQTSNGYTEEFTVMEDLMGLAIGWII